MKFNFFALFFVVFDLLQFLFFLEFSLLNHLKNFLVMKNFFLEWVRFISDFQMNTDHYSAAFYVHFR